MRGALKWNPPSDATALSALPRGAVAPGAQEAEPQMDTEVKG
jgi:hypothetical protein